VTRDAVTNATNIKSRIFGWPNICQLSFYSVWKGQSLVKSVAQRLQII